jgi:integrase
MASLQTFTFSQLVSNIATAVQGAATALLDFNVGSVLRAIAEAANLAIGREAVFTPHVLRHTAGTTMTRKGTDIVIVAELLGHSVETARRYSLPTFEDRRKAIERLTVDE